MKYDLIPILSFGELSEATTGVFLENSLITGHENGLVLKWNLETHTFEVLHKCSSRIDTISCLNKNEIAIGSYEGDLLALNLDNPKEVDAIREATYGVHSRVWRTFSPRKDNLIITSTYGVMNEFHKKGPGQWEMSSLLGHSHSIFGLGGSDGEFVASGDYRGTILIWGYQEGQCKIIETLNINNNVQDIAWHKDEAFATVSRSGRIHLFEKIKGDTNEWQLLIEANNARSRGKCIHITEDGKTIFAGTNTEIIQFDRDYQQIGLIDIAETRNIFSKGNSVFVLTSREFLSFERKEPEIDVGLIKYRHAKISLIGHTGVGKSTLCNMIITGAPGDVKSTYGKRIWNWKISNMNGELEKRIVFHDYGGQETVIGTFLPLLADSDIILILFQKNDKQTFTKALDALEQIKDNLNPNTKIFFVQTYVDQPISEINEQLINNLVEKGVVNGYFRVSPAKGTGINELKRELMNEISWEKTGIMIQSQYSEGLMKVLSLLYEKNANVVSIPHLTKFYSETVGLKIPNRHLRFLLSDLSNQGIVDFYPDVFDAIIINDEKYNQLRTEIPIFVEQEKGIVSLDELIKRFNNPLYLEILDSVYQNYKICIKNNGLRIFPEKLRNELISIPESHIKLLGTEPKKVVIPYQKMVISRLIEALCELNLSCLDITQTEGVFCWEKNACIYYKFQQVGDQIRGLRIECTYYIGGLKEQICDRLEDEFVSIVESLYGSICSEEEKANKKKVLNKNFKFEVALSYASEQKDYVDVAYNIISKNGIKCFYDPMFKSKLWGTNLPAYFHDVYYSQSRYCIMFISKEYVSKAWTLHESRSAIQRQIEQLGNYILPVIFDDCDLPGLQLSTIGCLFVKDTKAEQVASMFLEKLKRNRG